MATRIITPYGILGYPWLDRPQPVREDDENPNKAPQYGLMLAFTPELLKESGQQAAFDAMKAVYMAELRQKFAPAGKVKIGPTEVALEVAIRGGRFKLGLLGGDGSELLKGLPEGSYWLNARTKDQPGLAYAHSGADGKPAPVPAGDIKAAFYPGAICRASINVYAFENRSSGVTAALNNVQKIRDGVRVDGRRRAEDEFTAIDAVADLAELGLPG